MTDKFKIVEMKLDGGSWRVKFDPVHNAAGLGSPWVSVEREIFIPEKGMHERTAEEVIGIAHRELINELRMLFMASVMSVPGLDWETVRKLTVSEILRDLGLDDAD